MAKIGRTDCKDSLNTLIVNEEVERFVRFPFDDLARRDNPLTIVCSDALRAELISSFQRLAADNYSRIEMSDFDKVTIL